MAGWETKTLGEICEFQRGLTYGKSDEVDSSDNVVLRANNIDLATHSLDFTDLRYVSSSVSVPAAKLVCKGSLLICTASGSKSHLGKIAYVDEDYGYAFGGFMGQITPTPGVDGRYLYHALTSSEYKAFIAALSDGVNINNLKFDDLRHFSLPVPPLPEQQRIVAILDEAFEGIATAKANAEQNLKNARDLFDGSLAKLFAQPGEGWESKSVSEWVAEGVLAKPQDGNHGEIHPTKADFVDVGVPFVMAADLVAGDVDTVGCRFITESQAKSLRIGFAKSGDVLLSHKGTIGRVAILETSDDYVVLTPQVTYYRPLKSERVSKEFLYFCLMSPGFQSQMAEIAGAGSTRAYIGITKQLELNLTLPPIEEQLALASKLGEIQVASVRLAKIYEKKLAALDELKKSLLHQAFTGLL
ncbi:restriction endonuclease subunit S [Paenacidovorax monticola]|uniref:Restriction endonuclease subunit S n=1 Tax=Paenacidovorax monticola TaxID=1926868 RepID=A0A7H0HGN3_9BURK|nr:restriction endonuclease subunit S [Paenacidovorax monticola]QNP59699.1 restriction endonuclease subunit S [Paenacidovorax monticola]